MSTIEDVPAIDEPAPGAAPAAASGTASALRWLRDRPKLAIGGLLGAGTLGYLALVDPNTSSAYPPCPLKVLTGVDCAGCGGLRCTHALLTGDLERAADHNILVVAALPIVAYLVVRWALAKRGRQLPAPRFSPALTWSLVALLLVFSVVRNLPWGPLPYLFSDAS